MRTLGFSRGCQLLRSLLFNRVTLCGCLCRLDDALGQLFFQFQFADQRFDTDFFDVPKIDNAHRQKLLDENVIDAIDLAKRGAHLVDGAGPSGHPRVGETGVDPAEPVQRRCDAGGHRLTVYAMTGPTGQLAAFQYLEKDGIGGVYWQDDTLRYAVIGALPRDGLTGIATEIYRQLI